MTKTATGFTAADRAYLAAAGRWLGGWASSYFSFDIESSGRSVKDPIVLPVEVGWCFVEDDRVVLNDSVVLDWFLEPDLDHDAFAEALLRTHESMAQNGLRYPFTPRYLEKHGVPPREAMELVGAKLAEAVDGGLPVVGHNLYAFDKPVLERTCRDWGGRPLQLPAVSIVDTMCIERGRMKKVKTPPSGTRHEWYASKARGPEPCNLHRACADAYAFPVNAGRAHSAAYDALLVHYLIQGMKKESV